MRVLPTLLTTMLVAAGPAYAIGQSVEAVERAGPVVPADLKRLVKADPTAFGVNASFEPVGGKPLILRNVSTQDTLYLDVRGLGQSVTHASNLVLYDEHGTGSKVDASTKNLVMGAKSVLAVGSNDPATAVQLSGGRTFLMSSSQLITPVPHSAVNLSSASLRSLGLAWDEDALQWRPTGGRFEATLSVGVVDRLRPDETEPLEEAIAVQLHTDSGDIKPSFLHIRHVGYPFEQVAVQSDGTEDPLTIRLASRFGPQARPPRLPVVHPQLSISAPSQIPGFGLGFAEIVVSPDGVAPAQDQAVTLLLVGSGSVPDRTLKIDGTGHASTKLQSEGLGSTSVGLAPGVFRAKAIRIDFSTPWNFLLSMLLGAVFGAACLLLSSSKKKQRLGTGVVGVLVACGTTIAAYAGLRLPQWVPVPASLVGEAVPFALAFVCALASAKLIDWFKSPA